MERKLKRLSNDSYLTELQYPGLQFDVWNKINNEKSNQNKKTHNIKSAISFCGVFLFLLVNVALIFSNQNTISGNTFTPSHDTIDFSPLMLCISVLTITLLIGLFLRYKFSFYQPEFYTLKLLSLSLINGVYYLAFYYAFGGSSTVFVITNIILIIALNTNWKIKGLVSNICPIIPILLTTLYLNGFDLVDDYFVFPSLIFLSFSGFFLSFNPIRATKLNEIGKYGNMLLLILIYVSHFLVKLFW